MSVRNGLRAASRTSLLSTCTASLHHSAVQRAGDIVDFVRRVTVMDDAVGAVCGYATFDTGAFGNARYGSRVAAAADRRVRARNGKLEKSVAAFLAEHPCEAARLGNLLDASVLSAAAGAPVSSGDSSTMQAAVGKGGRDVNGWSLVAARTTPPTSAALRQANALLALDAVYNARARAGIGNAVAAPAGDASSLGGTGQLVASAPLVPAVLPHTVLDGAPLLSSP